MDVTNRDLLSLISVILLPFIRQSSSSFLREDTAEGAKLAKRIGGHLKTLQAISCISYILLYDWSSHLREQINRTFQFRNCHGKFFCSFWCIHGNNPRAVSVWGKRLHTKTSLPVGKRHLPMGKRASVTTANNWCSDVLTLAVTPQLSRRQHIPRIQPDLPSFITCLCGSSLTTEKPMQFSASLDISLQTSDTL